MKRRGVQTPRAGRIVSQIAEATSAVWGMPRAVAEAGLASAILPPADIAKRVAARLRDMPQ